MGDLLVYFVDLSSFPPESKRFLRIQAEHNVDPAVYELYRAHGAEDLTLFLKLRAEELVDRGYGLYLMVGQSARNAKYSQFGEIYVEAFENAAAEFEKNGNKMLASQTEQALLAAKSPWFTRSESDIKEVLAQECFRNVLNLIELHSQECLIDCKTGTALADFIWSVHGNSLMSAVMGWANKQETKNSALASTILASVRKHMTILAERNFPGGKIYHTYTFVVIQRHPRS